ncbi:MAG: peptidase U32 family protein [Bacteroidota bacterium]
MKRGPVELLAPCGSMESLAAAIQAGCHAVYFGVEQLNMRARSSACFSVSDIQNVSAIARKHGIKAYLTLNTLMYDHDIFLMRSIIDEAKRQMIDAVIACDHAVLSYARGKGLPVHISTQASISNIEAVRFYSAYADVMVLARELTLEQVRSIVRGIEKQEIKGPSGKLVRIEVFAHGALCMAVSGRCYLSLHSQFASANRGACVQNCRRSFIVTDKEDGHRYEISNEYIMSAADLCTIGFLDKLIDAGIAVLKIEGRGRNEHYVHTVTGCYREAIDAVRSGNYTQERIRKWEEKLRSVFNRGLWEGYYLGRTIGEWNDTPGSKASRKRVYIGKCIKHFEQAGVGEFRIESHSIGIGDDIIISGPTTGVIEGKVRELRTDNIGRKKAAKGTVVSIPVSRKVRPSDKLYKLVDA